MWEFTVTYHDIVAASTIALITAAVISFIVWRREKTRGGD